MAIKCGSRIAVSCKSEINKYDYGVVLYSGPVTGSEGMWVGVDWDDASRGKHNGEYRGTRYFTASHKESGSFVREKNIFQGLSIADAIREKYIDTETTTYTSTSSKSHKPIQASAHTKNLLVSAMMEVAFVGENEIAAKQSHLDQLTTVGLRDTLVLTAGTEGELQSVAPRVVTADLSHTMIHEWDVVAKITGQWKDIHTLYLSENKFDFRQFGESEYSRCDVDVDFDNNIDSNTHNNCTTHTPCSDRYCDLMGLSNIQCLFLNRCIKFDLLDFLHVQQYMPRLCELHLVANRISTLQISSFISTLAPTSTPTHIPTLFPCLEFLNLENNDLSDFQDISAALSKLPNLHTLILGGNPFPAVKYVSGFPRLQCISLLNNALKSWTSISELDKFPSLTEMRFSGPLVPTPTPSPSQSDHMGKHIPAPLSSSLQQIAAARYPLIVRMSKLKLLNRSDVGHKEREEAEIDHLKTYAEAYASVKEAGESSAGYIEFTTVTHPRYVYLLNLHGAYAPPPPPVKATGTARLTVRVRCATFNEDGVHQFPSSMSVGKLKAFLQIKYKMLRSRQQLFYMDEETGYRVELADDFSDLNFYAIPQNGLLEIVKM
eukprot:CFRG6283T1